MASVPLAALFLASQMFVKITSRSFIRVNVLVDPLMTDTVLSVLLHPQRNLFRAPILTDLFFYPSPGLRRNPAAVPTPSLHCFVMCLLGAITSLAAVPSQFSADGRFVNSDCLGYLRLIVLTFQKCMNLISLTLGELVVANKRSFDLSVSRGLYYTSLPLLTFKVALMS